jgi:hypothetical protein
MSLTLHDAIRAVLIDQPGQQAQTSIVAEEIKRRGLWRRPTDGEFPEAWQIGRRARSASGRKTLAIEGDIVRLK